MASNSLKSKQHERWSLGRGFSQQIREKYFRVKRLPGFKSQGDEQKMAMAMANTEILASPE